MNLPTAHFDWNKTGAGLPLASCADAESVGFIEDPVVHVLPDGHEWCDECLSVMLESISEVMES